MTMQDRVKIEARERGADVAQILYITRDQKEVQAREDAAIVEPPFVSNTVLDIRYWSCPVQNAQ